MRLFTTTLTLSLSLLLVGCGVFEKDFESEVAKADLAKAARKKAEAAASAPEAKELFVFEAEAGQFVTRGEDTWEVSTDDGASGSKFVRKIENGFYTEAKKGPGVTWVYSASTTRVYDVWLRARPNASGDSLHFDWAGESSTHHWPENALDTWGWSKMRTVNVIAGVDYEFGIWAREHKMEVDMVVIQTAEAIKPKLSKIAARQ